jgi:hypothetical protein
MKILKTVTILGMIFLTADIFGQTLPPSYQPMFNEIVTFFETIRGSNSITQGKNTLSVLSDSRIALRIQHKKQVKNLTFEKVPDEENQMYWIAANDLTIDMVNKYEDDLTKILGSMHKYAEKKSKE